MTTCPAGDAAQELAEYKLEMFKFLEIAGPIALVPIPDPNRLSIGQDDKWRALTLASRMASLKIGRLCCSVVRRVNADEHWPDDEFSADDLFDMMCLSKDGTHRAGRPQPEETIVYVDLSIDHGKTIAAVDAFLSQHVLFERDRAAIALTMRSDDPGRDNKVPMMREIHYSEQQLPWPVDLSVTPPTVRVPLGRTDLADSPEYVAAYLAGNVPPDKFYQRSLGYGTMVPVSFRSVSQR